MPIRRSGKTIGVITLATAESQRVYDEGDLETALTLADRAAVAIENARLYRELEVARASAELANRAKDEFLAMLGHELRNPLAPILTAVEMMQAKNPGALGQERAIIDRQLRHMVRLVDDLLDVSRIARHKIELVRECVDLSEVVQQALEMATPLFRDRDHTVAVDAPPGLLVDGDAVRLTQVVSNVLTNAAKYTQRGGRVEIQGVSRGGSVTLRVRDNGIGLAPEMLPRIFDLFVQDKQASDRAQGGLGLGLTIVRNLIELHGGSVTAHSDGPGRGVEIKVELPACVDRSTSVAPRQGTEVPPMTSPAHATVTRPRILVVDDNIDARDLLAMSLELKGYAVSAAGDGPSALEVARELQPAIALLDIGLPGMDGYELGRQLRMLPGLEKIHLIAVTGYGQSSDRERSHSASFADHLVKPIKLATLAAMLEKWTPPDRST